MNMSNLKKSCMKVCVFAMLGALTACSQTMYGVAKIESIPPGAEVINLKDDTHLGRTPLLVTWESEEETAKNATIELRKDGYVEEIRSFWVKMQHDTKGAATNNPQPVTIELTKRK